MLDPIRPRSGSVTLTLGDRSVTMAAVTGRHAHLLLELGRSIIIIG